MQFTLISGILIAVAAAMSLSTIQASTDHHMRRRIHQNSGGRGNISVVVDGVNQSHMSQHGGRGNNSSGGFDHTINQNHSTQHSDEGGKDISGGVDNTMHQNHSSHHGGGNGQDNHNFTEVVCTAGTDPVECGQFLPFSNATGILVCRQDVMQHKLFPSSLGNNFTMCVDPTKGLTGDTCGCCEGACPTMCTCPCDLLDLQGNVIAVNGGVWINATRHENHLNSTHDNKNKAGLGNWTGRPHDGQGAHGNRIFGGNSGQGLTCVSLLDSVTLQLGFVASFVCGTCIA